jgi:5'-nucleotidase
VHRSIRLTPLVLALLACRTPSPPPPSAQVEPREVAPIRLTLVGTNDTHGWVKPHEWTIAGRTVEEGGAAAFAGYLANVRADNPGGVLLLDAGDLFQGTLISNLSEGQVVIDVYNSLGYQAAAIGNHEFDYGPVGEVSVASDPSLDPFGALKARLAQAKFPMLSVNLYDAKTGERPSWLGNDGTTIVEVKGVKVGLLGLTTPTTPWTTNPVNVSSLRFGSLVPEAAQAAQRLRQAGAEVVIAISHAGGKCASIANPRDLSTCDRQDGEIFDLLESLPKGTLDAVIAGHTHAPLGNFVNGTPVIETPGMGRAFGVIELYVDPARHKVIEAKTELHPNVPICPVADEATGRCDAASLKGKGVKWVEASFLGRPVQIDRALDASLAPALARVKSEQERALGVSVPVTLSRNYNAESGLGDVLADSLRAEEKADVALLNPGGLRADLPAGALTFGAIYEVLPFDNTIATLTVDGDTLHRLLIAAYNGHKGVFQQSGLKVKLGSCPGQDRLKSVVLADGTPIKKEKHYKIAVPDFLARGGDGLGPVVSGLSKDAIDLGTSRPTNFRDALVAYWQGGHENLAAPAKGRIDFVDLGAVCSPGTKVDTQNLK